MNLSQAARSVLQARALEDLRADRFRAELRKVCSCRRASSVAKRLGVSGAYLSQFLSQQKGVGEKLLRAAAKWKQEVIE